MPAQPPCPEFLQGYIGPVWYRPFADVIPERGIYGGLTRAGWAYVWFNGKDEPEEVEPWCLTKATDQPASWCCPSCGHHAAMLVLATGPGCAGPVLRCHRCGTDDPMAAP